MQVGYLSGTATGFLVNEVVQICFATTGTKGDPGDIGPTGPTGPSSIPVMGEIYFERGIEKRSLEAGLSHFLNVSSSLTSSGHFDMSEDGRIRYVGNDSKLCQCTFFVSMKLDVENSREFVFAIYKNGISVSNFFHKNNTDFLSVNFHKLLSLQQNDYLELHVTTNSSTNIDIQNFSITILGN